MTIKHLLLPLLAFLGLQGCAAMEGSKSAKTTSTTNSTDQVVTVPASDYLNRNDVASPAARRSAGSGQSHSGMSAPPR